MAVSGSCDVFIIADFGEVSGVTGGKHVFACHNFLDYSGEARKNNIHINIEETMAILTRYSSSAGILLN